MDVRDAVEADAEALAALADAPVDVMRNLVHDRTVRVVAEQHPESEPTNATDPEKVHGFVSYDVRGDTVHVTQLGGSPDVCSELLDEPIQFARRENMNVEVLVPDGENSLEDAVERAGFVRDGSGPRFDGQKTVRYRWTG